MGSGRACALKHALLSWVLPFLHMGQKVAALTGLEACIWSSDGEGAGKNNTSEEAEGRKLRAWCRSGRKASREFLAQAGARR